MTHTMTTDLEPGHQDAIVLPSVVEKVVNGYVEDQELFNDAMNLHSRYCDNKTRTHSCVGQATIRRGEVCLDCPLCGKGEHNPMWRPQYLVPAEEILRAAGMQFHSLSREVQTNVLREVRRCLG